MLKQRVITGVILITLALLSLFFLSPANLCLVTAIVMLAAAWEWTNLMGLKRLTTRLLYLLIIAFFMFNSLFVPVPLILFFATFWWLLAIILIGIYPRASSSFAKNKLLRGLLGVIVLVPAWVAINYIRNLNAGIFVLLFVFCLIWGADTAAYFVGKRFGKTKLVPLVSPGKSVQGVVAGLVFSLVLALIVLFFSDVERGFWLYILILSLLTALFSVVGDLFESLLKRQVHLKDSGKMLPGHGGLLDRIDSLTAAAPIFALGVFLLTI